MHRLRLKEVGRASLRALSLAVLCLALFSVLFTVSSAVAQSPNIVISQVYGGGGNGGATYTHDFVEFFNRGSTSASLNGMSLQYGNNTGNFGQPVLLANVSLAPGQYYLLQLASQAAVGAPLPVTPDQTGGTNMGGTNGKVVLVNTTALLACGGTATGTTSCTPAQEALFIDLVGFGSATRFEGSGPTGALSSSTAAIRNGAGCTDTDNNNLDFTVGAPAPRNSATALAPCGPVVNTPPTVTSTTPVTGTVEFAIDSSLAVNFSEPVTLGSNWFSLACDASGVRGPANAVVSGGPQNFTIDLASSFSDGEQCTLTIAADQVVDLDATSPAPMEEDYDVSFTAGYADFCNAPYTTIGAIQGPGAASPMTGQVVTTMGVVTADFQGAAPNLRGYFLQSQDGAGDGNSLTSDGIFVFTANDDTVNQGDLVRVVGTVGENFDQTQLSNSTVSNCGTGYTVANTTLSFPVLAASGVVDFLERYEGMMVTIPQTMTVSDLYFYGRFHQIVLSADGRLIQPTHLYEAATPERAALQEANDLRRILLDDPLNGQNLMPLSFARGGGPFAVSPFNILRAGDTVGNVTGVLNYTFGGDPISSPNAWRVRPTTTVMPDFQAVNERPAPIARTAPLRVGSLNLLNFFNSFGTNGCRGGLEGAVMDCRGALSQADFEGRQVPKTVQALLKLDADIIAINEIENDGYGTTSAIQKLADSMNAIAGANTWTFVDPDAALAYTDTLGTDAIKVGILYKPASVTPLWIDTLNHPDFVYVGETGPRNRAALALAFQDHYGAEMIVVVNHLKSKGSECDGELSSDPPRVQGNCNGVRANAASVLMDWVSQLNAASGIMDVLLVGDYNSYAQEDPIINIKAHSYTDLSASFGGATEYSYVFGGQWGYLDYAFASPQLVNRVVYAAPWHINADEASVLDHTTRFKNTTGQTALWESNEFRTSDHDPLVVDVVPPSYPLTVTVVANNASIGSVTSIPAGISCGITCTAEFYQNAPVTLTATVDVSSHLAGWSEESCGAALTCTVPMTTTAKSVTATFDINIYTLTTATDGAGTGTLSPSDPVTATHGSTVTITATPAATSNLAGWSEASCGTALTCDVNLTADKTVTATFDLKVYTLTTATDGAGTGTLSPSDPVTATHGSTVTITATPAATSNLSGWSEASCGTALTCDVNLTTDKTVTATFAIKQLALTVATVGSGTVTPASGSHPYGSQVTLTAVPANGWTFDAWSGACVGEELTCTFTITADSTVTATFLAIPAYVLDVTTQGNGTVTSDPTGIDCGEECTEVLLEGTVITLTATADADSVFTGWGGNCSGTETTCIIAMGGNRAATATFALKSYAVTVIDPTTGGSIEVEVLNTVSAAGAGTTYPHGTVLQFTAVSETGYAFGGWTNDAASFGTQSPFQITVTGPLTIGATFVSAEPASSFIFLPAVANE